MRVQVNVIFRKWSKKHGGGIIAFIDDGDDLNGPGLITCYEHVGQHGDASIDLIDELKPTRVFEHADLLAELESIGYDVTVVDSFE